MSELRRLARALGRAAKEWGEIESSGAMPYVSLENGASVEGGVEPYLLSFRVKIFDPPVLGSRPRSFTVTVTQDGPE